MSYLESKIFPQVDYPCLCLRPPNNRGSVCPPVTIMVRVLDPRTGDRRLGKRSVVQPETPSRESVVTVELRTTTVYKNCLVYKSSSMRKINRRKKKTLETILEDGLESNFSYSSFIKDLKTVSLYSSFYLP